MPRGDGTGPLGTGPIGRGRGNCQNTFLGRNLGRNMGRFFGFGGNGFGGNNAMNQESLESQAARLEEQAANLRNTAKLNRKTY